MPGWHLQRVLKLPAWQGIDPVGFALSNPGSAISSYVKRLWRIRDRDLACDAVPDPVQNGRG